ncbi:hypothetical protein ACH4U6_35610 [Streptomyces netropsis]|uniref:hypothetical protein n=1 Tax=Streptomyces netropsis TaxID=55404 RepID=UPI0037B05BA0
MIVFLVNGMPPPVHAVPEGESRRGRGVVVGDWTVWFPQVSNGFSIGGALALIGCAEPIEANAPPISGQ